VGACLITGTSGSVAPGPFPNGNLRGYCQRRVALPRILWLTVE
jgi:hypothetical protein